jgi:putative ABC transport system ATP-binding protein
MSMLELREVSRSYGQGSAEVHALREVSLTADEGEMVAVMGPSGSGKSTLLTIAGTLEDPTSGEVLTSWADRVMFLRDGRVTDQTVPAPGPASPLTRDGNQ